MIEINKKTIDQLRNVVDKKVEIVNGASHLFEEESKIEVVGNVAAKWLNDRLLLNFYTFN